MRTVALHAFGRDGPCRRLNVDLVPCRPRVTANVSANGEPRAFAGKVSRSWCGAGCTPSAARVLPVSMLIAVSVEFVYLYGQSLTKQTEQTNMAMRCQRFGDCHDRDQGRTGQESWKACSTRRPGVSVRRMSRRWSPIRTPYAQLWRLRRPLLPGRARRKPGWRQSRGRTRPSRRRRGSRAVGDTHA